MDDLEFRKNATINPETQEPQFLQKQQQTSFNRQFVQEQQRFNQKLNQTLNVNIPENLAERLILNQQLNQHKQISHKKRGIKRLLASVATIFIILLGSKLLFIPSGLNSEQLAQQVMTHIYEDTHALNVQVEMGVPKSSIDTMLAPYGGKLKGPIGNVSFLGHCIVGGKTGVHIVLNTPKGLVTIILLPKQPINEVAKLVDNHYQGILYPTKKGSIAIIAEQSQLVTDTQLKIKQNLTWVI
ncbi:MAG: DUF3379 family protein [Gammaproteobacteria bacterium]|nr:DUF3379 family protein [Gammaproteobacteria bacterium]